MEDRSSRKPGERKDSIVRGAKVRVITKGNSTHLSSSVQKLYPLEIRSKGEGLSDVENSVGAIENPTRTVPWRSAAIDSWWKSRLMLDS